MFVQESGFGAFAGRMMKRFKAASNPGFVAKTVAKKTANSIMNPFSIMGKKKSSGSGNARAGARMGFRR